MTGIPVGIHESLVMAAERNRNAGGGSDAIEALKARRAAASAGHRPAPTPKPVLPAAARQRSPLRTGLALCLLAWAGAATWFAVDGQLAIRRLEDDKLALRAASDERVRALTRRLVGVASHQVLEQDGLAERLADIITRQVELENRQSTLGIIADRLAGGGAPAPPPGRSGALEPGQTPPSGAPRSRFAESLKGRPLREQFDRLDASIRAAQQRQVAMLATFGTAMRNRVEVVRSAVAELGLKIAPDPRAPVRPLFEGVEMPPVPAAADAFDKEVDRLRTGFADGARWSALADELPLQAPMPLEGNTTSNFGTRRDPFTGVATMHAGMDFRSPVGTPLHATAIGKVIWADVRGGYGNMVEIDHGHDLTTRYAHLSSIQVAMGQTVTPGTIVGLVGSTGRSTGPHLHYETRIAGSAIDPAKFIVAGAKLHAQAAPALAPAGVVDATGESGAAEDGSSE